MAFPIARGRPDAGFGMINLLALVPFDVQPSAMIPANRIAIGVAIMLSTGLASITQASELTPLLLPVACEIGKDCSVQNFFDHDTGPDYRDYHCGRLSYDGHDGTDIRLPNLAAMRAGVAVVAAAPGRVRAIRDAMPDVSVREIDRDAIRGREAGNGVVLKHGADWETQYSHLRRGSVRVKPGEWVEAGQVLGLVGLSGKTEFPHLHFEVRHRGKPVDPFVGVTAASDCGVGTAPLWDLETLQSLRYRPTGLLQAGFATRAPIPAPLIAGERVLAELPADAPALLFWIEAFGVQAGDRERLRVVGPTGEKIVDSKRRIDKSKARWLSYAGRKRRGAAWRGGAYRASYRLTREAADGDTVVIDIARTIEVR